MGAAIRQQQSVGYGEKLAVRIITVDKEKNRVECATRDGAMIWAAVWETGTIFRWPEVGETWTVRKDTGVWRLDQIVQNDLTEKQSEAVPKTLLDLPEGDTRILGETIHTNDMVIRDLTVHNMTVNGITNFDILTTLPSSASEGDTCILQAATGVFWNLVYTGETTYPWAKIGGPPLFAGGVGGSNASEVFTNINCPFIVTPALKMDALIEVGATSYNGTANAYSQTGLKIGAAATEDFLTHHQPNIASAQHGGEANAIRRELASGITVRTEIRQLSGGIALVFNMWMKIDPLRVGSAS